MNWSCRSLAKKAPTFLVILMLAGLVACSPLHASISDEASSRITNADNALKQAFRRVLEAEEAGGNVSGLTSDMDEAGELLAKAEMAYRNGNLTDAMILADRCSATAEDASVNALASKNSALADSQQVFDSTLAFSTAGAFAFVVAVILSWFWFKHAYAKKLLNMKCEVVSDAEA